MESSKQIQNQRGRVTGGEWNKVNKSVNVTAVIEPTQTIPESVPGVVPMYQNPRTVAGNS
jgi:hypothetical protein